MDKDAFIGQGGVVAPVESDDAEMLKLYDEFKRMRLQHQKTVGTLAEDDIIEETLNYTIDQA